MSEAATVPAPVSHETGLSLERQNRRERRIGTSWAALIRLPDGRELPCIVRDVSKSGAKLSVPAMFPLARTFLLKAEGRGFVFAVTLMWRRGDHVGVKIDKIAKIEVADNLQDQDDDSPSDGTPAKRRFSAQT